MERALVDLITMHEARSSQSSLWCAAHALDASAVVWRRLESCPPRYRELVELLEVRLVLQAAPAPTATAAAVGLRTAATGLAALALGVPSLRARALGALDEGVVALAGLAVCVWLHAQAESGRCTGGRDRRGRR